MMKEMADLLMASQGLKKDDIRHFVLHSAGRRVIEQARQLMDLDESQIAHSRRRAPALRQHVLGHHAVRAGRGAARGASRRPGDWGLMIALGPGFAAEGALLRW